MSVNATNTGNLVDDLSLVVGTHLFLSGSDSSQDWGANGSSSTGVSVNETEVMTISAWVPYGSWNGSIMRVDVVADARGKVVLEFHFFVEVSRVPGWGISSSMSEPKVHDIRRFLGKETGLNANDAHTNMDANAVHMINFTVPFIYK